MDSGDLIAIATAFVVAYVGLESFVRLYSTDYKYRFPGNRWRTYPAGSDDTEEMILENKLTKVADSIDDTIHPWKPVYRMLRK